LSLGDVVTSCVKIRPEGVERASCCVVTTRAQATLALAVAGCLLAGTAVPARAQIYRPMTMEEHEAARWGAWQQRQLANTPPARSRKRHATEHAKKDEPTPAGKGQPAAKGPQVPKGPLQIIVSIASQRVTVYSGGTAVAEAPVSTGTAEHPTPTGVFSIIQKARFHRSNIYSDAPMPYMQRITWSGVALHQGVLPGHPASHGCIRLPTAFAQRLWSLTRLGARVVVARSDIVPVEFTHAALFVPKAKASEPKTAQAAPIEPNVIEPNSVELRPARVETAVSSATRDNALPAGPVALALPPVIKVSAMLKTADAAGGTATAAVAAQPYAGSAQKLRPAKSASAETPKEPPLQPGPVSVFVSRKEGRLFVRKGFDTVFDVPVTIRNPDQPLGTHVFTAMELTNGGAAMRWTSVTMPSDQPVAEMHGHKAKLAARDQHIDAAAAARAALDRVEMPKEAVERISEMLSPGASLIVSDQGRGDETGTDTDFVILTR
jgi:lipoprotein-anchoring transpeptidase ErfK/SrfK